jgi:hypothetical protein
MEGRMFGVYGGRECFRLSMKAPGGDVKRSAEIDLALQLKSVAAQGDGVKG